MLNESCLRFIFLWYLHLETSVWYLCIEVSIAPVVDHCLCEDNLENGTEKQCTAVYENTSNKCDRCDCGRTTYDYECVDGKIKKLRSL